MEFLNKYNLKFLQILKIGGLAILGIIVLVFLFRIVSSSFNALDGTILSSPKAGFDKGMSFGMESVGYNADYKISPQLSTRNVTPPHYRKAVPAIQPKIMKLPSIAALLKPEI
ncbi:hypothetical protein KAJ61_02780 [Candidatus Parcubacteria bacterium]|nr:hypothetical protein [Candidatus Parcubacteria bacterium]